MHRREGAKHSVVLTSQRTVAGDGEGGRGVSQLHAKSLASSPGVPAEPWTRDGFYNKGSEGQKPQKLLWVFVIIITVYNFVGAFSVS